MYESNIHSSMRIEITFTSLKSNRFKTKDYALRHINLRTAAVQLAA